MAAVIYSSISNIKNNIFTVENLNVNPTPNDNTFCRSKLKEFADDNLKFDESGKRFSTRVENNVGKGEIARYEHILLFPQCFQKTCTADT